MEAQEALEAAVRNAIRSQLGYADADCDVSLDGQPPPRCGEWFVAVWSPSDRQAVDGKSTCLHEAFNVSVTVTRRSAVQPYDRLARLRYDLLARADAVRALVHRDSWTQFIVRAAEVLAGWSNTDPLKKVGFSRGLRFDGLEPVRAVGGEWFHAQDQKWAGLTCTARFADARRVQSSATAS